MFRTLAHPVRLAAAQLLILLSSACSDNGPVANPAPETASDESTRRAGIVDLPVTFKVVNRNTTPLPCLTDGLEYEIKGNLLAPAAAMGVPDAAVTLYLHGVIFGVAGWRFYGLEGYDFPLEMAKLGHVSVVIDKLGYGDSGLPDGLMTCAGADADIADQIVSQLRSGEYLAAGKAGRPFSRVALGGISGGGGAAEMAAYTYNNVDALAVLSWADVGSSPPATAQAGSEPATTCARTGDPKFEGGPEHYTYTLHNQQEMFFYDYDPAVLEYVQQHQERDPCGFWAQAAQLGPANRNRVGSITAPVLVVMGDHDALYAPGTAAQQAALYTNSPDVTAIELANTGHALRGERSTKEFRARLSAWLSARGF